MLAGLLEVLSFVGILVVWLLGILVLILLLVLFMPVSYRIHGSKKSSDLSLSVRVRWLAGILRLDYRYPRPGSAVARVFGIPFYDSAKPAKVKKDKTRTARSSKKKTADPSSGMDKEDSEEIHWDKLEDMPPALEEHRTGPEERKPEKEHICERPEETAREDQNLKQNKKFIDKFLEKIEKIKYTFYRIYDKIKDILENIAYYKELIQEDETKLLFRHLLGRIGSIWKNIRPRTIKGHVLFGTGSPDTTGYAMGVFGMISPFIGNNISVSPDFEEIVLEGEVIVIGYVTVFVLLINGLKIALDSRLRLFWRKLKREDHANGR